MNQSQSFPMGQLSGTTLATSRFAPNQIRQSKADLPLKKIRLKAPTYSLEQRAHTSSMTSTDTSGIRRGKLKNDDGTRYFENINKTRYLKKLEIRRGI